MPPPVETRLARLLARRDIASENCTLMGEYWYRPGEVLVHRDDLPMVEDELSRWGGRQCDLPDKLRYLRERDFPVVRFELEPRMSVDAVVSRLRQVTDGPEPRVAPNHVVGAWQSPGFMPADLPVPARNPLKLESAEPCAFTVAVIDSGLVQDGKAADFVDEAGARLVAAADGDDRVDVSPTNGMLDDADGHGTFIAGIVLREAPSATVRMTAVLDDDWVADDLEVANAILANADADVINLSLGGYARNDVPPVSIVEAINSLPATTAVVAAAGNYAKRRPMFPAALKRVIAVAAVDETPEAQMVDGLPPISDFSGHGWWVDACASGTKVLSNYLTFTESNGTEYTGWATWSGTSFATPKVAGRIAALAIASGRPANQVAFELLYASGLPWRPDLGVYVG